MARLCWEELKEKDRRGKVESGWEEERKSFFRERRMGLKKVEKGEGINLEI